MNISPTTPTAINCYNDLSMSKQDWNNRVRNLNRQIAALKYRRANYRTMLTTGNLYGNKRAEIQDKLNQADIRIKELTQQLRELKCG